MSERSVKADTNAKWTSSDKYRDNWDKIFKKEKKAEEEPQPKKED